MQVKKKIEKKINIKIAFILIKLEFFLNANLNFNKKNIIKITKKQNIYSLLILNKK